MSVEGFVPTHSSFYPSQRSGGLRRHHALQSCSPRPPRHLSSRSDKTLPIRAHFHPPSNDGSHPFPPLSLASTTPRTTTKSISFIASAGRSKKNPGGPSPGRIEGNSELRRQAKENARRRSRRLAQNLFYRRNNPPGGGSNQADSFTEEELEMIGLGYDRSVRFMSKDDPNLRHPYDWYKYGRYGPYSWRGIVVGPPIRGRFSDERVTLIGEVRDHEEWERIEQFDMSDDFSRRVKMLEDEESRVGLRYFWVFVRHPKWRASELPWQQWTLVSEVAVEASRQQRLDKWSLMGRFGNKTRAMITQCAAWMRPDIIYVRRPVYQCRFEPQDDFFRLLAPLLDPETESRHLFELRDEACTYFGGLCRIVKIGQKAYVDDVVNAYEKLSDEAKSQCLEFLLTNHPMELLHPYTKEWKAKLEEMELGCDAPDQSDDEGSAGSEGEDQITDQIEDDAEGDEEVEEDEEEEEEVIVDVEVGEEHGDDDAELGTEDEPEESPDYWEEQWKKALRSSDAMEKVVKKSIEVSNKLYEKQQMMDEEGEERSQGGGLSAAAIDPDLSRVEWETSTEHMGRKRRIKKGKVPPELFLRAAVRPFTYRNLVKEIVLLRHAIIDGDVSVNMGGR